MEKNNKKQNVYVSEEENRNVRLKAYKESGKTKYKSI